MKHATLRTFLFDKRIELYEELQYYQEEQQNRELTQIEKDRVIQLKSELEIVKSVITICNNRNKF